MLPLKCFAKLAGVLPLNTISNYFFAARIVRGGDCCLHETIYGFPLVENHAFFQITICGISYCDGSYRIERRNSPVYTLEYIIKGEGKAILPDGTHIHPAEGDVYLLHSGENQLYFSDANNPWTKIWCNVSGHFVEQMIKLYRLENIHFIPQCCIEPEMKKFLQIATNDSLTQPEIWEQEEIVFHKIL